jgi:5,10-methylenetetrahydromethanopterin reductase
VTAGSLLLSCALAPSIETPAHVRLAEELGYHRAWVYDSPALYHDVFMALALAADRTSTIGLGTGVLIPSLRHPMDAAASIGALAELAPGRVTIGVGTGFSGQSTLGKRPLPWRVVEEWVLAVQGLLRGDRVEWDGALIQMMHPDGFAPPRPIVVPWTIAAEGPKGSAVAARIGDGVFSMTSASASLPRTSLLYGTVLDDGEDLTSPRVIAAAGPAAAVVLHGSYDAGRRLVEPWCAELDAIPAPVRHLAVHAGHLVEVTERDRPYLSPELIAGFTVTGSGAEVRERVAAMLADGVNEVAFQPAGPDIGRELESFRDAVKGL